jgi:hypothetical protein
MATDPAFSVTPKTGVAALTAAETNLQVPTQAVKVYDGAANGSQVLEIVVEAVSTGLTPTTVAGLVYIFTYDGTNYTLRDTIPVTAVAASTTLAPFRASRIYSNLMLGSTEHLYASQSVVPTTGQLRVSAQALDG